MAEVDKEKAYTDIFFEEMLHLSENCQDEVTIIDVRRREEVVDQGCMKGSHVIPHIEIVEAFDLEATSEEEFKAKYGFSRPTRENVEQKKLLITCRSGRRVGLAIKELEAMGFRNMRTYFGAWIDWSAKGGPVYKWEDPQKKKED